MSNYHRTAWTTPERRAQWEAVRPWITDAACGLLLIGFTVAGYVALDRVAEILQAMGWLQ